LPKEIDAIKWEGDRPKRKIEARTCSPSSAVDAGLAPSRGVLHRIWYAWL